MAGRYYGGMNEKRMKVILSLFPNEDINTFVDGFFGMGNVSRLGACGMAGTKVVAYELERGMYTLHEVIRDDAMVYKLIEKIKNVKNTRDYFEECHTIITSYNSHKKEYDKVDVALAELACIRLSRNNARNSWRNIKSYEGRNYDHHTIAKKRTELDAIERKFYTQTPVELMEMYYQWQKIELFNENCMEYLENWVKEGTLFYLDPPYLPEKRGIKCENNEKPVNKGYMEDMSVDDHEALIDKIIKISNMGAKCMVCSSFELDEKGELIGVADDPYTRLMQNGFRMVIVEKRYSTVDTHEVHRIEAGKIKKVKKKRTPKAEVVYINYTNITGAWSFYKYMDYKNRNKFNR
jgi:DNA adenine methylase